MANPGTGNVTLTGHPPYAYGGPGLRLVAYEPTVVVTQNHFIDVPAGSLTLSSSAPTVAVGESISTDTGVLVLTGYTPTLNISTNHIRAPPDGSLSLTGYQPYSYGGPGLRLVGYEPTIVIEPTSSAVLPGTGSLSLTGYAPAVVIGGLDITVNPGVGSLSLVTHAPAPNIFIVGAPASLQLTGYVPTLSVTEQQAVNPGTGSLALAGYAPAAVLGNNIVIQAQTGALALSGQTPTVTKTELNVVSPGSGALSLYGRGPTIINSGFVPAKKSGGRTRRKRRYLIEIDGEFFDAETVAQVRALLSQAKEVAKEAAPRQNVRIKAPRIKVRLESGAPIKSKAITREVDQANRVIRGIYKRAADQVAELREKMERREKRRKKDEEAAILLLL